MTFFCRTLVIASLFAFPTLAVSICAGTSAAADETAGLRVGWATAEITPEKPVPLVGFFHKRISEGVSDPLTATALALESVGPGGESREQAIMVSCDLLWIRKSTQDGVRRRLQDQLPEFDPEKLVLHATHTHQGPLQESGALGATQDPTPEEQARGVMTGDEYGQFLHRRLAAAAVKAWQARQNGGCSWALDQAVVGFNRRFVYFDGTAKMLGPVNTAEFDCVEGVEDHGLSVLFFWNQERKLTGLVVNVACPAQAEQGGNRISADFWHEVREELAARHSPDVFVLPQCGAAGDIYTQGPFRHRAEAAMAQRRGISWRREIARRIVDGVQRALLVAEKEPDMAPAFKHTVARVKLPKQDPPLVPFYQCDPVEAAEFHALRLGEVALVTNPFELFTDYGIRIQARSSAVLTFVVQLSCQHSGYLPTARALRGGGYSADKYLVGPEGGQVFVDECVQRINGLWP
jgi:hypothetical protein